MRIIFNNMVSISIQCLDDGMMHTKRAKFIKICQMRNEQPYRLQWSPHVIDPMPTKQSISTFRRCVFVVQFNYRRRPIHEPICVVVRWRICSHAMGLNTAWWDGWPREQLMYEWGVLKLRTFQMPTISHFSTSGIVWHRNLRSWEFCHLHEWPPYQD